MYNYIYHTQKCSYIDRQIVFVKCDAQWTRRRDVRPKSDTRCDDWKRYKPHLRRLVGSAMKIKVKYSWQRYIPTDSPSTFRSVSFFSLLRQFQHLYKQMYVIIHTILYTYHIYTLYILYIASYMLPEPDGSAKTKRTVRASRTSCVILPTAHFGIYSSNEWMNFTVKPLRMWYRTSCLHRKYRK